EEAKLQLGDSTLLAPYGGVIAQRFVELGQTIAANKAVVRLQNSGPIDVIVDVPEAVIAAGLRSAPGQIFAELNGEPGAQRSARIPVRIKEVAQVADPATQTFQATFSGNAPRGLTVLPGMTAVVTITSRPGVAARRILVPVSAIFKEDSGA